MVDVSKVIVMQSAENEVEMSVVKYVIEFGIYQ